MYSQIVFITKVNPCQCGISRKAIMEALMLVPPKNMLQGAAICSILSIVAIFLYLWFSSRSAGLSHISGPFLARYTDAWGVYAAWTANRNSNRLEFQRDLQAKYGDVVRTGPHSVTVFDSRAVPTIYGLRSRLDKVRTTITANLIADIVLGRCLHTPSPGRSGKHSCQHSRRSYTFKIPQTRL